VLDPANQVLCADICISKLKIDPSMADEAVRLLRVPKYGLDPTAAMDRGAVENTLNLRRFFDPKSKCGQPEDYYDLSYHTAAMKLLQGGTK
jgi:hypothetical protein